MYQEWVKKYDEIVFKNKDNIGKNITDISKLNTSITDLDFYEGLSEIIEQLDSVYKDYDLHSMNDSSIAKYGEKRMLGAIISYLNKIKEE